MRIELARVLAYPQIVPRLAFYGLQADEVLAAFDRHARRVEAAPKAPVTCADPDDQIFIDLAVRHRCALLSKDRAVLRMRKRLAALGVQRGHRAGAPTGLKRLACARAGVNWEGVRSARAQRFCRTGATGSAPLPV
jgi:hypothetical protein